MTERAAALSSGKGHHDENFPVASVLVHPRHRDAILSFYRFARAADDVADHATAPPDEKLAILDTFEETLLGRSTACPEAKDLRNALAARDLSPQHALDLLVAFRRDVTKLRYADWADLMDYCRYSAMPVGRFVLDVHGEERRLWPYNDALCAALQVINHLQDCGKDYRALNRVYVPLDHLAEEGLEPGVLAQTQASPALLRTIAALARRTAALLDGAKPFAAGIADFRLGLEVSVIQALAEDLNAGLLTKDPLSERVHHRKSRALGLAFGAAARFVLASRRKRPAQPLLEP